MDNRQRLYENDDEDGLGGAEFVASIALVGAALWWVHRKTRDI